MSFASASLGIRHKLVKLVAPTLYKRHLLLHRLFKNDGQVPRPMILKVHEKFGDVSLVGVEIGVYEGVNAKNILKTLNVKCLFLVDPYVKYYMMEQEKLDAARCLACKCLKPFEKKTVWITKRSDEAYKEIPDELDFVYVDGNHSYAYVKKDLELYFPKVKEGGIIGGHDFTPYHAELIRAINDFCSASNLTYSVEYPADWWIIK